ncbi:MAG TPA: hypothetical protein VKV73_16855 [Chloroflexota bacterium]|nr:hypothetical protein [Chloroflexota bacterium]
MTTQLDGATDLPSTATEATARDGALHDRQGVWVITTAIRDTVGNHFLSVALAMVGCVLLGDRRNWLGGLALVNAALGWLDLAFARALGLPPHVSFLLIVVWLVMLGSSTWQPGALAEDSNRPRFTAQSAAG